MKIPAWVLEGSNGALAVTLLFVVAFQLAFLLAALRKFQLPRDGKSFYRQMKPVIALTVMASGFFMRFGDIWLQRSAENHSFVVRETAALAISVHIVGTALAIMGILCWLRVSLPSFCGTRTWIAIIILAFIVGIIPAFI